MLAQRKSPLKIQIRVPPETPEVAILCLTKEFAMMNMENGEEVGPILHTTTILTLRRTALEAARVEIGVEFSRTPTMHL